MSKSMRFLNSEEFNIDFNDTLANDSTIGAVFRKVEFHGNPAYVLLDKDGNFAGGITEGIRRFKCEPIFVALPLGFKRVKNIFTPPSAENLMEFSLDPVLEQKWLTDSVRANSEEKDVPSYFIQLLDKVTGMPDEPGNNEGPTIYQNILVNHLGVDPISGQACGGQLACAFTLNIGSKPEEVIGFYFDGPYKNFSFYSQDTVDISEDGLTRTVSSTRRNISDCYLFPFLLPDKGVVWWAVPHDDINTLVNIDKSWKNYDLIYQIDDEISFVEGLDIKVVGSMIECPDE